MGGDPKIDHKYTIIYDGKYYEHSTGVAKKTFGDLTITSEKGEIKFTKATSDVRGTATVTNFEKKGDEYVILSSNFKFISEYHIYHLFHHKNGKAAKANKIISYVNGTPPNLANLEIYLGLKTWPIKGRIVKKAPVPVPAPPTPDKGWDIKKLDTARNVKYLTEEEKNVILHLNMARSNPPLYAKEFLEERVKKFIAEGKAKTEGEYYVECYNEMLKTKPLPILQPSNSLFKAALDHALDMGNNGKLGHKGTDESLPADRIKRYGKFRGNKNALSENCAYGFQEGSEIVLQLLVDDQFVSRGHRKNILDPQMKYVGTAIRDHHPKSVWKAIRDHLPIKKEDRIRDYKVNCVQDFATEDPQT